MNDGALEAAMAALEPLGDLAVPGGPIGPLTTYRVGGAAAVLVTVRSDADLLVVADAVRASALPVLVVGRGSNLLVSDRGFPGIAVTLDPESFAYITVEGMAVRAGAATALPVLARRTVESGLTGFEWAVGVPGSLGGAVRMNAGGHGSDIAASLQAATIFRLADGESGPRRVPVEQLGLGYRRSAVGPTDVVTEAELRLAPGDRKQGLETIREIVRWRREHQPGGQNAGSVFTNPPGDSAGRLIDAAGLRGHQTGTAAVSDKHANFIQSSPGGSADDVHRLIETVRREVFERLSVDLHPEVRLIGFDDPRPLVEGEREG